MNIIHSFHPFTHPLWRIFAVKKFGSKTFSHHFAVPQEMLLTHFSPMFHFYTPIKLNSLEILENLSFSDVSERK